MSVFDNSQFGKFELLSASLWIITVIIFLIFGILFVRRAMKREEISKSFNISAGILFLGLGIRLLLPLIIEDRITMFFSNVSMFIATFPLGLYLEKIVFKKTKYMISLAAVILFVVFIIMSILSDFYRPTMYIWVMPPFAIELLILAVGYIYLIIKSTGVVKRSSILIFIGSVLFIGSSLIIGMYGPIGQNSIPVVEDYLAVICPLISIVGALIAAKGFFGYS